MAMMPPSSSPARCMFYTHDVTGMGLTKDVERWLTSAEKPSAQGTIEIGRRFADVYHLGTMAAEIKKEWP